MPREESELRQGLGVLGAATVGMALGFSNIAFLSFGLFILPLSAAYGWSRGAVSLGFTLMTMTVIGVTPVVGGLMDRVGVRRVLIPSIVLFAVSFASLGGLGGRLWQFYTTCGLLAVFGAGTLGGSYSRVLIGWFDRRRGLALGTALAGIGLGGMVIPPFVQALLARGGLVAAYLGVGALVMVVGVPNAALFIRERPGSIKIAAAPDALLRDRYFFKMAAAFFLLGIYTAGTLTHLVPMLVDRGVSAARAAWAMSTLAGALVIGRILAGYLLDRIHPPRVVAAFLAGPVVGLALLAGGATGGSAFACAILLGLGMGAEFDFMSYLVSRYLAPDHFARNYGAVYAAFSLGASVGPLVLAVSLQRTGSYSPALALMVGLVLAAIGIYLSLGGPRWPRENTLNRADCLTATDAATFAGRAGEKRD